MTISTAIPPTPRRRIATMRRRSIIIRMYFYDDKQHHDPHLHAEYAGKRAAFGIQNGEVLSGELPPGKARLVQAWIEIHREDLLADWALAVNGEEVFKVEPLK